MAKKAKAIPAASKRNTNELRDQGPAPGEDEGKYWASKLVQPNVGNAVTIRSFTGALGDFDLTGIALALKRQCEAVHSGDMKRAEEMLIVQAHTLDAIFSNLARNAALNMAEYPEAFERFMRLGFKAQSQCRATLETLAAIKNPPVIYARQANVTTGPQQINNGVPITTNNARAHAPAREIEKQQNKLSGGGHELPSDSGTPALAGGVNQALEAVDAVNRAEVKGG